MQSLSLPMVELMAHTGDYLGWGRGETYGDEVWVERKRSRIQQILNTALRWVYFEASIDGRAPHPWSWLTPLCDLTLESGERFVPLPLDFEGFADNALVVTLTNAGSGVYNRVFVTDPTIIESRYAISSQPTGRPIAVAIEHLKGTEIDRSNRRRLSVYPIADQGYRLRGKYHITGEALTSTNPFAYGGTAMAEVFKSACRAVAESELDNLRPGEGTEWVHYQSSLRAAVLRDGRLQAKTLGRNTDGSDPSHMLGRGPGCWWENGRLGWLDPVSVGGVVPD